MIMTHHWRLPREGHMWEGYVDGLRQQGHGIGHVRNQTLNFKARNVRLSLGIGKLQRP